MYASLNVQDTIFMIVYLFFLLFAAAAALYLFYYLRDKSNLKNFFFKEGSSIKGVWRERDKFSVKEDKRDEAVKNSTIKTVSDKKPII